MSYLYFQHLMTSCGPQNKVQYQGAIWSLLPLSPLLHTSLSLIISVAFWTYFYSLPMPFLSYFQTLTFVVVLPDTSFPPLYLASALFQRMWLLPGPWMLGFCSQHFSVSLSASPTKLLTLWGKHCLWCSPMSSQCPGRTLKSTCVITEF